MPEAKRGLAAIPRGVWLLGAVSLCMDVSSELIHSLLPLYLAVGLGASTLAIGIIEGIAEATALIVKVFSGVLSDMFRRRKPLVVLGYGLAAVTKLAFPLAPSLGWIVGARFADRVGKGIRGAPRDALIADLTPETIRGASFGLRQALDTVGAVGGPLLAIAAMSAFAGDFKAAFWVAVVPAFLSVALLVAGVDEPERAQAPSEDNGRRLRLDDVKRLGRTYAVVVAIAAVLTLARFSEAFLVLRARDVGLALGAAPWVMVVMSVVYAVSAYPAGAAADRGLWTSAAVGRADRADRGRPRACRRDESRGRPCRRRAVGTAHGTHAGAARRARRGAAPADLRGTAFGVFNLVCGIALLAASVLAGWLWDAFGPALTFYAGAAFTAIAWVGFLRHGRQAARAARARGPGAVARGCKLGRRPATHSQPNALQVPWPAAPAPPAARGELYYRHTLPVRVMHWVNVVALTILLMSGLNIFDAHPALYWGKSSYTGARPVLEIGARMKPDGSIQGVTRVFGARIRHDRRARRVERPRRRDRPAAFPWWATIPDDRWLSMARSWHFFFAWILVLNGLAYLAWSIGSRHLARDLAPDRADLRSIPQSIRDHLRFRHPSGEAAKRYNVLQKLAYLAIIFVAGPAVILMGLAMSPWLDAIWPGWVDLVGGRQSARTLHFIVAWLLVAFVAIHVFEVIVSGLWNHLRSMITGRYRVSPEASHEAR